MANIIRQPIHHSPQSEQTEIRLNEAYNTYNSRDLPRADDCHNCANPLNQHAGGTQCLFGSTAYRALSHDEWLRRYNVWANSQTLETVMAAVAYAATGGVRED